MTASGDRAMSVRPSGWTQRTVTRQVEEWSGARSTRVERSDRPASALFVELRGFDALVEHLGEDEARSRPGRCGERARKTARASSGGEPIVSGPETRPVISATFE